MLISLLSCTVCLTEIISLSYQDYHNYTISVVHTVRLSIHNPANYQNLLETGDWECINIDRIRMFMEKNTEVPFLSYQRNFLPQELVTWKDMHVGIIKTPGANIWQAISLCLTLSVAPHVYLYHTSQGQPKSLGGAWCLIIYTCHQSLWAMH